MGEPCAGAAAGTPVPCGAARSHDGGGDRGRVRWRRRARRSDWARGPLLRRALAARLPPGGPRLPVRLWPALPWRDPGHQAALWRGDVSRGPRGPAGKATIIALAESLAQCRARCTCSPLDPFHILRGETEAPSFKSVTQGHTWRELEFEPQLPNSSCRDTGPAFSPPHTAPPRCHLTFLPP